MTPPTLPPVLPHDKPGEGTSLGDGVSQTAQPLPPELWPNIDHLVFEDGKPVESLFAERQMRLFVEPLYASWKGPPESGKFVAMSNVGLFPEAQQTTLVPDGLLSIDVEAPRDPRLRPNRSYLVWVYGKPPDVVLELVSDRSGGELEYKLRQYARIGVAYYVVFDPDQFLGQQTLHVFRREGPKYTPMAEAWFPEVGLGVKGWQGIYQGLEADWLRWHDQTGQVLPTGEEQGKRAREAQEQARKAQERAEQERAQKERALAQLRALGVTPEP
jgi:Uma2 family endonuclease